MSQMRLGPEVSELRVRALAGVLAGFRWPGRSFEKLTARQQRAALQAARNALVELAGEE